MDGDHLANLSADELLTAQAVLRVFAAGGLPTPPDGNGALMARAIACAVEHRVRRLPKAPQLGNVP